ncbi:unnamed protein product [Lasius platythorax]|uniref:Uncharacterized protein n=1 Tax=Lasius platythorax TaxID=488582 RepID=A0AAV2NDE5_9HYME
MRRQREQREETTWTESEWKEEVVRTTQRICVPAPDAASSSSTPFPPVADGQEKLRLSLLSRRGALCVSENVALIGGSVAVMRYQPPANKRINVKMWRWSRRRKKTKGT